MVGASKILTVSYGTFSCTLEGFDDSFNTMKAIAEYFRDLAADDRYFGAEPPVPDAEMLAKIAEQSVNSRVEARISDGGVVLRPREITTKTSEQTPAQSSAKAPVTQAVPAAPVSMPPEMAPQPAQVVVENVAPFTAAAPNEISGDSVAAKLQRIRAAVALNKARGATALAETLLDEDEPQDLTQTPEIIEDAQVVLDDQSDVIPADIIAAEIEHDNFQSEGQDLAAATEDAREITENSSSSDDSVAELTADAVAPEIQTEVVLNDALTLGAEAQATEGETNLEIEAPEPEAEPEVEDISVLAETIAEDETAADSDAATPHDDDTVEAHNVFLDDILVSKTLDASSGDSDESEAVDTLSDETFEIDEATETSDEDDDDFSALLDRLAETTPEEDAAETSTEREARNVFAADSDEGFEDDVTEANDASILAALSEISTADPLTSSDEAPSSDPAEEKLEESVSEITETPAAEDAAAEEEDTPRQSIAIAARARARARVIKIKNSDLDKAIADGSLQDYVKTDPVVAPVPDPERLETETTDDQSLVEMQDEDNEDLFEDQLHEAEADSSLSDEDEAALVAELAELSEIEQDSEQSSSKVQPMRLVVADSQEEADVTRLLEETNTQLENSESTRRRSAFAHLKAAVAATVADRMHLGGQKDKPDETNVYRDDLAKVVKAPTPGTERKKSEPIAPLVLVSEQRIDIPAPTPAPVRPVQPRRVAAGNLAVQELEEFAPEEEEEIAAPKKQSQILAESTSFAEFATSMGATELPDLLEAAAAYTAFIEGRPYFSRTQVMKQVAGFEEQVDYTREAGLRSFGQLLRQGRFQKIQRNQFVISKDTKFKPEPRYNSDDE